MVKVLYIILVSVFLILQSCLPYCDRIPLNAEDYLWFRPYETNDTILFTSDYNSMDTMIITEKSIHDPKTRCPFDLRGCSWMAGNNKYYGYGIFFINSIHNGEKYQGSFSLNKRSDKDTTIDFSFFGNFLKDEINISSIYTQKVLLRNGKIIDGIILYPHQMTNMGAKYPPLPLPLDELIWNIELGLVQYTINGEIYHFYKKL